MDQNSIIILVTAVLASPLSVTIFNKMSTNKGIDKIIKDVDNINRKIDNHISIFEEYKKDQVIYELDKKINKMLEMSKYSSSCLKEYYNIQSIASGLNIEIPYFIKKKIDIIDERIRGGLSESR